VSGLPPDALDSAELKAHFSLYGEVRTVASTCNVQRTTDTCLCNMQHRQGGLRCTARRAKSNFMQHTTLHESSVVLEVTLGTVLPRLWSEPLHAGAPVESDCGAINSSTGCERGDREM
jgi:hypothetical protein